MQNKKFIQAFENNKSCNIQNQVFSTKDSFTEDLKQVNF